MAGRHKAPARGALAGIKEDAKRAAAAASGEYNPAPAGVGNAWSHNFLNQKPWHPLNFRNQAKVFEAEQAAAKEAKAKAVSKYLRTLSYLSEGDRKAYADRQSVSFMYQKPPGLDAALSRDGLPPESRPGGSGAAAAGAAPVPNGEAAGQAAAGASAPGPGPGSAPGQGAPGPGMPPARASESDKKYIANMLGAVSALQEHEKWEVKHMPGGGQRSPPRGGADPAAANQQLLVDSDSGASGSAAARDAPGGAAADGDAPHSKRRRLGELEQAEAVLRAAGLDLGAVREGVSSSRRKDKKDKKDKQKRKHKHKHKD